MRKLFFYIISLAIFFLPKEACGFYNPTETPNNRFGIHVADVNNLKEASELVNSSGGDWGYITVVIQNDDRNAEKWQLVFDEMRKFHLIPLVRIASSTENGVWKKLEEDDIENWARFLASLDWVVENRYVIVGNEPNHAKEWGGKVSASEYASYLINFSEKLKNVSDDFFILPAGLDASAPNGYSTMDEEIFIRRIFSSKPEILNAIDG